MSELLFAGARVVLPTGIASASVRVRGERIVAVEPLGAPANGATVIHLGAAILLPGLVDTHVHVNEPGRTEWEGFASATRAAAAGGVTTILDMPLNAIPATTSAAALAAKRAAAAGQCHVDVGFIGGVVPGNANELAALHAAGVFAWKCFLVDAGVPEFPRVNEAMLREVLPQLAAWDLPLMVHAELPGPIAAAAASGVVRRYTEYANTRPVTAESDAVALMIRLSEEYAAAVHIVHVSSGDAAYLIDSARARGVRVTGETCPHYLSFAADDIPDGATEFKCAPPIRTAAHRLALWQALEGGALGMVVSDHSPAPASLKAHETGDLTAAWGGIASLQLGLSAVWTLARRRGRQCVQVVQWLAMAPADLVRLRRKGRIAPGYDADLVLWEPDTEWTVDATQLQHRHPLTPYHGLTLAGHVRATYLRGTLIYHSGSFSHPPMGRLLDRDHA